MGGRSTDTVGVQYYTLCSLQICFDPCPDGGEYNDVIVNKKSKVPDRHIEFFPPRPHGEDVGKSHQGEHHHVGQDGDIKNSKQPAPRGWIRPPTHRHLKRELAS